MIQLCASYELDNKSCENEDYSIYNYIESLIVIGIVKQRFSTFFTPFLYPNGFLYVMLKLRTCKTKLSESIGIVILDETFNQRKNINANICYGFNSAGVYCLVFTYHKAA